MLEKLTTGHGGVKFAGAAGGGEVPVPAGVGATGSDLGFAGSAGELDEILDHLRRTNIPGMNNQVNAGECPGHLGTQEPVGVGNHSNPHRTGVLLADRRATITVGRAARSGLLDVRAAAAGPDR